MFFIGCKADKQIPDQNFTLNVRLASEPDNLHPMFSKSSYATQIENLILIPLAEFDPQSLVLTPLLVTEVNNGQEITEGEFEGFQRFSIQIRPEATWADGTPITAEDYLFTIKAARNPKVNASSWKGYLSVIESVEIDPNDPKKFEVVISSNDFLTQLVAYNFNIFPKHLYDPEGLMSQLSIGDLETENVDSLAEAQPNLEVFAQRFEGITHMRDIVTGAGPYELEEWATGQFIRLKRKADWWADKIENRPSMLNAYPDRIVYHIIPDENTALTSLKDGSIDVMGEVTSSAFINLRDDKTYESKLDFYTPAVMQYHYLELNCRNPKLSDVKVRQALAHLLDYDALFDNLTMGLAEKTTGPFHPGKPYYNKDLKPIEQDFDKARKLLAEAGWADTNDDGVVDKEINGKRTELELEIMVSQRPEGQQLALIMKESAKEVGINLELVTKASREIIADLRKRDFEIVPLRNRSNPSVDDPYQLWHSDNDNPGGNNRSGFRNERADEVIMEIRSTEDDSRRIELFKELQEIIFEEQPVIFLYVPLEKIVVSEKYKMQPSDRRPGYFENLFQLAN